MHITISLWPPNSAGYYILQLLFLSDSFRRLFSAIAKAAAAAAAST